jgi:4-hydroxybenzoate polyprenyltransferase
MIKFEHTLFALPFAGIAAIVAVDGLPTWPQIGWLLAAMVGARSSAMTVNRLVDCPYDRLNPRTAGRALPAGLLTKRFAWGVTACSTAVFLLAAAQLSRLALLLAPAALLVIWGYSFTKRFTSLSHLVLGLALAIAPSAAWIALTGTLTLPPMLLSAAVLTWAAGFDIIYACQDVEFDRQAGLYSLPSRLGLRHALTLSSLLHGLAFGLFVAFGWVAQLGVGYGSGLLAAGVLLIVQHRMVRPHDLRQVNAAFFTANGLVSLLLALGAAWDVFAIR